MICLLVFICCLAAVTALTVGMVLKVVTTLVEAFLDIVVRYGVILICTALICLAVFILAGMVIELIHGANIILLLLSLGLWVLSLGLAAFFASLIGSSASFVDCAGLRRRHVLVRSAGRAVHEPV